MDKFIQNRHRRVISLFLAIAILLTMVSGITTSVKAYTQADVDRQLRIAEQKRIAAEQKKKDAEAMQSKISIVSEQITETTSSIQKTARKITDIQSQISGLEKKIQDEQSNLDREQEKMSQVIASWYMEGESGLLEAMIGSNSLSQVMDKQQYYESLRQQIQIKTEQIQKIKDEITLQKNELGGQLVSLNDLKSNQASEQDALERDKAFKSRLLANDKSAVTELNQQAEQAASEANRIASELRKGYCISDGGTWINGVCSKIGLGGPAIHKGSGGVQLNVPYYSQQDSSWRDKSMGSSGITIGDAGCLMTSLAMAAAYFGLGENPATLVDKSAFQVSGNGRGNFLGFNYNLGKLNGYEQARGYVDLNKIDSQLVRGNPVVVKVWTGSLYHWITLTGGDQQHGYSWNDPWPWRNPPIYNRFYNMRTFD